ncbi:hypothetical protein [Frateuria aurantia]|uniref:hypothetical protein n=1 Tax=Frateuria aurantia TaxID=81475 RepID=UPI00059C95A8|nr:hypothetical protein [Frateuria aurantia]
MPVSGLVTVLRLLKGAESLMQGIGSISASGWWPGPCSCRYPSPDFHPRSGQGGLPRWPHPDAYRI